MLLGSMTPHTMTQIILQRKAQYSSQKLINSTLLITKVWARKRNQNKTAKDLNRLQLTSMARNTNLQTRALKEDQYSRPMPPHFTNKHHQSLEFQKFISAKTTARINLIQMLGSQYSTNADSESTRATWRETQSSQRT